MARSLLSNLCAGGLALAAGLVSSAQEAGRDSQELVLESGPLSFNAQTNLFEMDAPRIKQGGLSIGWLSNGLWASLVTIADPGPFIVALEAPAAGNYSFVIANNLRGSSLTNVCELTRLAWLP